MYSKIINITLYIKIFWQTRKCVFVLSFYLHSKNTSLPWVFNFSCLVYEGVLAVILLVFLLLLDKVKVIFVF